MDSFEVNKIAGALLGVLLFVMGLNIVSGALFAPKKAGEAGYALPEAAAESAAPPAGRRPVRAAAGPPRQGRPGEGPGRGQEVPGLPHLREGRAEQGRPEPLRRRRRPEGARARPSTTRPPSRARAATGTSRSSTSSSTTRRAPFPARSWLSPAFRRRTSAPMSLPTCAASPTVRSRCRRLERASKLAGSGRGRRDHHRFPRSERPPLRRRLETPFDTVSLRRAHGASCRHVGEPAAGARRSRNGATAHSLLGEPKYPAGFRHFDYVNPDAPKGGLVRLGVQDTFDNFNLFVAGVKGAAETGLPLIYDTLMETALDEVSTEYGLLAEAVRHPADYSVRDLSPAPGGALARRPAGHGGRRDLLVRDPQGEQPAIRLLLQATSPRRRRPPPARSPSPSTRPATASCRRSSASYRCCRSTGGRARRGRAQAATSTETTLEPPLGSGPYRLKSFDAGRTAAYERVRDYWGARSAGEPSAGTISTRSATSTTATRPCCSKPSRATATTSGPRTAPATGRPAYDFPGRAGRGASSGKNSRCARPGRMQAFVINLRRAEVPGRRACGAPSTSPSISRTSTARSSTASTAASTSSSPAPSLPPPGCRRARSSRSWKSVRDKVPAAVFTEPYRNPVNGSPEKVRGEPPGGPAAAERGGLRAQEPAARRQADRRALRGRVPRLRHEPRALRHALCPGARADRHRDVDPHRRRGAVPEPAAQLRLRRDHRSLGRRGCRPGTSSASSGAPRPPTGRARATPPASRTRASTR